MGVFLDENGNETKEKDKENQKDELIDKSTDGIKDGFFQDLEKSKKMAGPVSGVSFWQIFKIFLIVWFIVQIVGPIFRLSNIFRVSDIFRNRVLS